MSRFVCLAVILIMTLVGCVYGVMADTIFPTPQYYMTPRPDIQLEAWCMEGRLRLWTKDQKHGLLFCEERTPEPSPTSSVKLFFPLIGG